MGKVRVMSIAAIMWIALSAAFAFFDMLADAQVCATLAIATAILAHLE